MSGCQPQPFHGHMQVPNCNDPVFRAWCAACELVPGELYDVRDYRLAMLEELMQGKDPTYDPEQDREDDYLTRGI